VLDSVELGWIALGAPAQVLEEAHVGDLHVGDHPPPAEPPGGLDRESHQPRTEVIRALLG